MLSETMYSVFLSKIFYKYAKELNEQRPKERKVLRTPSKKTLSRKKKLSVLLGP